MDNDTLGHRSEILATLIKKSNLKQRVFDNTFTAFNLLKESLHEMNAEFDDELEGKLDKRVRIDYRDRGKFEAQIQIAGEMLIFTMHTNVFDFDSSHAVLGEEYVREDRDRSYCGVINIYNFLADSFRYNRADDEGYLIGRVFVNREGCYFVEGKEQDSMPVEQFGTKSFDRPAMMRILQTAVLYSLGFDLWVPPYEEVLYANVEQFNTKQENSKMQTGKRMGHEFSWK